MTLSEADVVHLDSTNDALRLAVPIEARSYELHGLSTPSGAFVWQAIRDAADTASAIAFDATPSGGVDKRLLSRSRTRYLADDLSAPLAHASVESKALVYDSDAMAMTDSQRQAVFGSLTGAPTNTELTTEGGYVFDDNAWWVRTGHPTYDAAKFYAVTAVEDPYGNVYSTTYDSHSLLTVSSSDPLGNTVTAVHDYRLLSPWQLTDANGNRSQIAFDILGFVVKSAIMGKVGDSDGDTLSDPTSTFEYDLFAWQTTGKPNWTKSRTRETHQDVNTRWLEQRSYFSGTGGVVMVKSQARPGLAPQRDQDGELVFVDDELQYADTSPNLRWVGNGRVVQDNKGNVIKAYEPYYSSTPDYEDEAELVEQGVTAINHYDPLGRLIRTDLPNGTFSKVVFAPWEQTTWDPNDNVLASDWYAERVNYGGQDVGLLAEKRAAQLAAEHDDTPTVVHLDTLGRPFLSVAHNKDDQAKDEYYETRSILDIQGNVLEVEDARGNSAETRTYGMLGQSLFVGSVDAGDRWHLLNALGQPLRSWDSRDQRFSHTYDTLRRPVDRTVSVAGGAEKLLARVVYGDLLASPTSSNHAGRVYRIYDGAGVATTQAFDFKGHPTSEQRQLVTGKTTQPDWSALLGQSTIAAMATAAAPLLDAEVFSASSQRDALGRVLKAISPDNSEVLCSYDEGGGLQKVELKHRGSATAETVVGDITYNARGQRESVVYGTTSSPTTTTTYTYDAETYRLAQLVTVRHSDTADLQDLSYHYDPVGNITDIRDTAQQTVYFQNAVVEAANSYTYDPLYRLVQATGREHATQGTAQRSSTQLPPDSSPLPMANDPNALRRYTQSYTYDPVGNLETVVHAPASGTGWTRRYQYRTDGNRLVATSAPGDSVGPLYSNTPTYSHTYPHDVHGNFSSMPHMPAMDWDELDQLHHCTVGSQDVYFQYAGGQRIRKYVAHAGGTTEERIYLGPFELYRKLINGTLKEEWGSLHISDDTGRIVLVETHTIDDGNVVQSPTSIWCFQLSNHLGSAVTEVTETGAVISYEEYHPYGTSAYRLVDSQIDVPTKRYRYTGMERDDETGLGYHTARYYAPWLGRWTACDPLGLRAGADRYPYALGAPSTKSDPNGMSPPEPDQAFQDVLDPTPSVVITERPDDWIVTEEYTGPRSGREANLASQGGNKNIEVGEGGDMPGAPTDNAPPSRENGGQEPGPPPVDYGEAPFQGGIRAGYETALDEAFVKTNPIWGRVTMGGIALILAIPAVAEDIPVSLFNITWHGKAAGQHLGRMMLVDGVRNKGEELTYATLHVLAPLGSALTVGRGVSLRPPQSRSTAATAAKGGVNVDEVLTKPESLWGRSADEIAAGFKGAGYETTVRTSRSGKAQIVKVSGHPQISQIQVHPGGGRHGGAYVKISTTSEGKIKVVDPETYKPTPDEKVRVVPFRGDGG